MTTPLPVIVGFGGYNAAGRSSSHQGFRRMVLESLSVEEQQKTIVGLACLMGQVKWDGNSYRDQSDAPLTAAQVDAKFRSKTGTQKQGRREYFLINHLVLKYYRTSALG